MIRKPYWAALSGLAILFLSATAQAAVQAVEVPEPASLALMGVAVGTAAWLKFRRRK